MIKKVLASFLIVCMLTSLLSFNVFAQSKAPIHRSKRFDIALSKNTKSNRKPGQLIVKYKNDNFLKADKRNILKHGRILKTQKDGLVLLEVPENKIAEKMEILKQNINIEYVVPNYVRTISESSEEFPNDPEFFKQWGLQVINAQEAWSAIENEDLNEVIVAVIDTGMDMNHEDLKDRVVPGYDFVDMDDDPSPGPINEEHATHVAGIIAASTDNSIGIAGTAGTTPVKLMPLRVLEAGFGEDFNIAQAIIYAVDNGARVINMSLSAFNKSDLLIAACNYAFRNNVVIVAAAGNFAMNANDFSPAGIPGVITVSAIDDNYSIADFSNYGSSVELAAPGVGVLSTIPGDTYESYSGTSMAAPFVSAACALLISKNPTLSIIEVEQYLTDSAQDLGKVGKDESFGYGLLDLANALNTTEITPRLEIMNVAENSTLFDVVEIQTRFTYPNKILKTDLYIDSTIVDSIYNETVSESVYNDNMFQSFKIDTYQFIDGLHTLKAVAEDIESNIYTKEVKVNIRNNVYTGLRVNLTHEEQPVNGAYIEIWNKYQLKGETYYDFCYATLTAENGTTIIPGSAAPNGNDYLIVASYEFKDGDRLSYATIIEEAISPGIVKINGDNLVRVTVDSGLSSDEQHFITKYIFPGSNQGFELTLPDSDADGSFETYLNPGTYIFSAAGIPSEDVGEPLFLLKSDKIEINSENSYVHLESNKDNLSKLDINYKNIHGFLPENTYFGLNSDESKSYLLIKIKDIFRIPDIYVTPGDYSYYIDIFGQRDKQSAYINLEGTISKLQPSKEIAVNFGGTFTGKIGLDKKKFIPGEDLYIDCSVTDSYGNILAYMDYLEENIFEGIVSNTLISYKTSADKVKFKAIDTTKKALLGLSESDISEEIVEFEYKLPITLSLVDSRNNVIMTDQNSSYDYLSLSLPQNLATGNYKLKFILDIPYLIQSEISFYVDRNFSNNAVKFNIELPDKTKATSASVEAVDTITGNRYFFYGEDLVNGEMYIPLLKGNYKFIVNATKRDIIFDDTDIDSIDDEEVPEYNNFEINEIAAIYVKDGKSPAIYNLSSSQLQKIDFLIKDEEGNAMDNASNYYLSIPITQASNLAISIGSIEEEMCTKSLYISPGIYSFISEVYEKFSYSIERVLTKLNTEISLNDSTSQIIEFTSDNFTEFGLDPSLKQDNILCTLSDPKTGYSSYFDLTKERTIKISKGLYTLDFTCEKEEYGNAYYYLMTTQKDFSSDVTYLKFEPDLSMTIMPNKSSYKAGETLKTTNVISDRYGNRVIDLTSYSILSTVVNQIKDSKGKLVLRKHDGEIKLFNTAINEYLDIPFYDIRAPFIFIKDSFDDVIFSAKSHDFYTHSEIKLDSDWISSGSYKIEWTLDIDTNGNLSAESTFNVK